MPTLIAIFARKRTDRVSKRLGQVKLGEEFSGTRVRTGSGSGQVARRRSKRVTGRHVVGLRSHPVATAPGSDPFSRYH